MTRIGVTRTGESGRRRRRIRRLGGAAGRRRCGAASCSIWRLGGAAGVGRVWRGRDGCGRRVRGVRGERRRMGVGGDGHGGSGPRPVSFSLWRRDAEGQVRGPCPSGLTFFLGGQVRPKGWRPVRVWLRTSLNVLLLVNADKGQPPPPRYGGTGASENADIDAHAPGRRAHRTMARWPRPGLSA